MTVAAVLPALAHAANGPVGGDAARRAARAELRRSEYRHDRPGLLSRAVDWVGRHLDGLFSGSGGSNAVLIVLVVIVVIVVLLAVRAGAPTGRRVRTGDDPSDPLAPVTSRDHRRIAAELTAQGRHAEAMREWLRAAVQTIEERGVLPPRPGRTGSMTAREAGPLLPRAATDLAAATTAFDEVWFGGRPASPSDVAVARSAADAVVSSRIASAGAPQGLAAPW